MKNTSKWASLNDLIFEHRNKLYGAYILRKQYPNHVNIATLLVVGVLFVLALFYFLLRDPVVSAPYIHIPISQHEFKPLPDGEKPVPVNNVPVEIIKNSGRPVALKNNSPGVVRKHRMAGDLQSKKTPSKENTPDGVTGTGSGTAAIGTVGSRSGTHHEKLNTESEIYEYAELLPQYPHGDTALHNIVNGILRYPEQARINGIEGKVFVSFVVSNEGEVHNVKIEKGIGSGCDEEVVRAVKQLKGIKPPKQAGRAANSRYVLPVTFRLM